MKAKTFIIWYNFAHLGSEWAGDAETQSNYLIRFTYCLEETTDSDLERQIIEYLVHFIL